MSMRTVKSLLVTGGAGFIGSAFIRYGLAHFPFVERIVNLDLLTYAADLNALEQVAKDPRYVFVQGNICDQALIDQLCKEHHIDTIVHFAAESHVDRSISGPKAFLETNVLGTFQLLEVVRKNPHIHFHHISTDEVYGSLPSEGFFTEESCIKPNSPYSASKAASDCFVRAYTHTYHLSTTLSHCTNNYGPYQHREKFIPHMILCCQDKKPLPVYGNGLNVRDWIYVDDHVEALWLILQKGKSGEVYDVGGECELQNIVLLNMLIEQLSSYTKEDPKTYQALISYVHDRPGHDLRYAINCAKIKKELGWKPSHSITDGLRSTISWYLKKGAVKEKSLGVNGLIFQK